VCQWCCPGEGRGFLIASIFPLIQNCLRNGQILRSNTGYAAKVDLTALGHAVSAVVRIKPFVGREPKVIRFIQSQQCVVSAYNVTGEYAFVMEVSLESTKTLDALLESMSEFSHTDTSVILSAIDCGGFTV